MNIRYFSRKIEMKDYPNTVLQTKDSEKKNGDQEDRCRSSNICLIGIPEETENESDYLR